MAEQNNWVKESVSGTPGTGTIDLGGAEAGFIQFEDAFVTADTVHYSIVDGNNREIGIGTLTTGTPWTLARTTPLETLDSGTYDDTSPTAISLTSAAIVSVDFMADMPGTVVQSVSATPLVTTLNISTPTIPDDDTIPQSTEGTEVLTVTITPKYADSIIRVTADFSCIITSSLVPVKCCLFRDSGTDTDKISVDTGNSSGQFSPRVTHDYDANATTSTTFKVRAGSTGGTAWVNASASTRRFGGVSSVTFVAEEIRQ